MQSAARQNRERRVNFIVALSRGVRSATANLGKAEKSPQPLGLPSIL